VRLVRFYRAYVDFLVDQGDIERALMVAEASRARVLAERHGVSVPAVATPATLKHGRRQPHRAPVMLAWPRTLLCLTVDGRASSCTRFQPRLRSSRSSVSTRRRSMVRSPIR
jgi:hypothetical protein